MKKIIGFLFSLSLILTLTFFCASAKNEVEGNDSYNTANSISQNDTITGTLSNRDDVDYYKIVPTSNGKISIDFLHTYVDNGDGWGICIYKYDNGEYIELSYTDINMNSKESIALPYIGAVKNGVYYVKVTKDYYAGAVGYNYTLKTTFTNSDYYEREINNSYNRATSMTLNKSYSGVLNNSYDEDFYKITPTANGKIAINFVHTFVDNSNGWGIRIYKYDDGEYIELSYTDINMNSKESIALPYIGAVKNEIYYIKVTKDYYGDAVGYNYTLKTSFTSSNYYEREVNNSYNKATSMTLNKSYSGVLNDTYDEDFYKVSPTANGKISISFVHTFVDNSNGWGIRIYKYDDGEYIELSYTDINMNSKESIALPYIGAVKNEIYYIKVTKDYYGDAVGYNYTLKTSFTSSNYYERELNDKYSSATKATVNKTYSGVLNDTYDEDFYKITAPAKGTLNINFLHTTKDTGEGWRIYIYNYKNEEYTLLSETVVSLTSKKSIALPSVGTAKGRVYYVKVVKEYSGDSVGHEYKLELKFNIAKPTNPTFTSTASTVTLKWSKVSQATGYKIYKYDSANKKYIEIADTKNTNYKISKLKAGTKYTYYVRAYLKSGDNTYYSSYVKFTTATVPAQVTNLSVSSPSSKTAKVTYSKVSGATGYQIYYSTSKDGTYKKLTSTTKTSYTKAKLTPKKTYYFKVRAYKNIDGKTVYGSYSSIKSIKIK